MDRSAASPSAAARFLLLPRLLFAGPAWRMFVCACVCACALRPLLPPRPSVAPGNGNARACLCVCVRGGEEGGGLSVPPALLLPPLPSSPLLSPPPLLGARRSSSRAPPPLARARVRAAGPGPSLPFSRRGDAARQLSPHGVGGGTGRLRGEGGPCETSFLLSLSLLLSRGSPAPRHAEREDVGVTFPRPPAVPPFRLRSPRLRPGHSQTATFFSFRSGVGGRRRSAREAERRAAAWGAWVPPLHV